MSAFSSEFVSSVDDFRALFAPNTSDRLLLCYDAERDGVTAAELTALEDSVRAAAAKYATRVRLHLWDCSSDAFEAARQQLGKEEYKPLLAVVYRQTIADMLKEPMSTIVQEMDNVCERLASYQRGGKIAFLSNTTVSSVGTERLTGSIPPQSADNDDSRMVVDVSKLVGMGKRLMTEGKADYAEKFFNRALGTLDAVKPDCDGDENVDGSIALCLAWLGLTEMVQGKNADVHMLRLEKDYSRFCDEVGSDVARVRATHRLVSALPLTWSSESCSQKKLRDVLTRDPHSHEHRCALVVTFFLAGDMERCLTEAVKLRTLNVPFGTTAIAAIGDFIGHNHALMQAVGMGREQPSTGQ